MGGGGDCPKELLQLMLVVSQQLNFIIIMFLLQSNNIYINKLVAVFVYYSFQML